MRIKIEIVGAKSPPELYDMDDEQHTLLCHFAAALQGAAAVRAHYSDDFLADICNDIEEMAEVTRS